jgi:hypothetical protein
MEIFNLISDIRIENNGKAIVCLKPENEVINEYIATYRTYDNITLAQSSLVEYIEEMRPLLYHDFVNMENVPVDIRNNFTLN